jgi:hypothetical protein
MTDDIVLGDWIVVSMKQALGDSTEPGGEGVDPNISGNGTGTGTGRIVLRRRMLMDGMPEVMGATLNAVSNVLVADDGREYKPGGVETLWYLDRSTDPPMSKRLLEAGFHFELPPRAGEENARVIVEEATLSDSDKARRNADRAAGEAVGRRITW